MATLITESIGDRSIEHVLEALHELRLDELWLVRAEGTVDGMHETTYRGAAYIELTPRWVVQVLVPDDRAALVVDLLEAAAVVDDAPSLIACGAIGLVVDVRTGERTTG